MGLKDIVNKAKKVYTTELHGTEIRFSELGYEEEVHARKEGEARAKRVFDKPTQDQVDEYATIYVYYKMLTKAGEDIDVEDIYKLSTDYHRELIMAINMVLQNEVHTEAERLQEALRKKLLNKPKTFEEDVKEE